MFFIEYLLLFYIAIYDMQIIYLGIIFVILFFIFQNWKVLQITGRKLKSFYYQKKSSYLRANSISRLVEREKRKNRTQKIFQKYLIILKSLYEPSRRSLFIIFSAFALCLLISHIIQQRVGIDLAQDNHYQNLIAIHSGISAIIFALFILVAENLRDNKTDMGRILLKESFLFPLSVCEILSFLAFIVVGATWFNIFSVILIALFTIFSLSKIICLLLNKYTLQTKVVDMLRGRFVRLLDSEATRRIGNNILLGRLYKEDGSNENGIKILRANPFIKIDESKYWCFKSSKSGIVADIDLGELDRFTNIVESRAKESQENSGKGFSFFGGKSIRGGSITSNLENSEIEETVVENKDRNINRYITKDFKSNVDEGESLILIDKKLIDEEDYLKMRRMANRVFKIGKQDNFGDEVKNELDNLAENIQSAIKGVEIGTIGKLTKQYIGLIEGFLEYMNVYGGGFSQKSAEEERNNVFFGTIIKPVGWVSNDIRDIYKLALESKNIDILREIVYLPIALAKRAIDYNDHLIFQEYIRLPQLLCSYAFKEMEAGNKELAEKMFEWSHEHIRQLASYHLEPKFTEGTINEENFRGFALYIIKIIGGMAKLSIDNKNTANLDSVIKDMKKVFEFINNSDISQYLDDTRNKMLFELASWIFSLLERDKSDSEYKKMFDKVSGALPINIKAITRIFLDLYNHNAPELESWELQEKGDGMHTMETQRKLERFYAVKSLSIIENQNKSDIENIELEPSREFAYLADGIGDLVPMLDDIKDNPANWNTIMSSNSIEKAEAFKALLNKTKQKQEEVELNMIRNDPISQNKVKEFKDRVIKTFYTHATLRNILSEYLNVYKDETSIKWDKDKTRFGTNIIDNKEAFFENWHVHYSNWGDNYGESLSSGEISSLLESITNGLTETTIDNFEKTLREVNSTKNLLIFVTHPSALQNKEFREPDKFVPWWNENISKPNKGIKGLVGEYVLGNNRIPVFEIYDRGKKKEILILDKTRLGTLIQHYPLNPGESIGDVADIFYISVKAFSENPDMITKFIETSPPQWLADKGNKETQTNYLKERVLIEVFERFEFKKSDNFWGYRICISNTPSEDWED